ncbi:iron permease [Trametes versicolor FP-101664 SS1]|uniref:iron permease n=1 Tax=Trametes versicolor (strain FP-101664) TaxID=717944 RepID=UPI0004622D33|nr:iron permease [Trametes versicolor FP-101664 SS1]EIW60814.1 iron permease [Trametes versicolor FP-101664 SS1]
MHPAVPQSSASATRLQPGARKGSAFWLCFLAIVVCNILSALDVTAVSTVLPTITHDLDGDNDFVWIGAAYGLASTAALPLCGRLADVFGRRPIMLMAVAFFFVGSALCGSARSMRIIIVARTIQGIGGGAINTMFSIILSDLVPLVERGLFQGLVVIAWAFAAAIGPVVGGSLAQNASWRWLFYINLPLAGIAFALVAVFLRVRTPEGTIREKLGRLDGTGNFLIIAGTTLALIALTWGGITYPWTNAHVLAPLILGGALIVAFLAYEMSVPREPTVPLDILKNRTSFGGFLSTFVHGIVSISLIYYFPVYFQACKLSSPGTSGVQVLPTAAFTSVAAVTCGITVKKTGMYRPINYLGWVMTTVGLVLLSTLKADSGKAEWAAYQVIAAIGIGLNWVAVVFPILAPLPVARGAPALAFYNFLRTFAQTWGVTISATIVQNELKRKLPQAFLQTLDGGAEIAFAVIPALPHLHEPLRTEVREAFAESLATIWRVMAGVCAAGFVAVVLMREVPMPTYTDDQYGLQQQKESEGGLTHVETGELSEDKVEEKMGVEMPVVSASSVVVSAPAV